MNALPLVFLALDITMGFPEGIVQLYPHCHGITVLDASQPLEDVQGIVRSVEKARPCIGQPSYLVAHVELGVTSLLEMTGRTVNVYLAPSTYLAEHGLDVEPGDLFHGTVAHAGDILTAISVDLDGRTVALRDEQGRPFWAGGRVAH